MEAKNTLMKPGEISELIVKYCGDCRDCATNTSNYPEPKCFNDAQLKAQAEISFKAGIKEVAEWMREHKYHGIGEIIIKRKEYEAKLKEWGG